MEASLAEQNVLLAKAFQNLAPAALIEHAIHFEPASRISSTGALVAFSGDKTGRSPSDKRIAQQEPSVGDIWWGEGNVPLTPKSFAVNLDRAIDYLSSQKRLYCVDGYAGWDPQHRLKIRVLCSRPYHALFMHTMLIRPTAEELEDFGEPDFTIYNAGEFPANRQTHGMTSKTSICINFESGEVVILGTEYAGEMKKAVFTIMNYLMPKRGVLSMHCSATADARTKSSALLFGLSGTGKTTLSADPNRLLIGDDEHCWSDDGVFNIEGGCYAKTIGLRPESEPEIYQALRFGSVLENVRFDESTRRTDYHDTSITQNTRGAYPIEYIPNAKIPCVAGHPTDIIFLTCDAFGVLPPVSRLSPENAMYHFISGYTAKVAGTEMGISEPQTTFSPCFGGPFLAWHPMKYAELLATKVKQHGTQVWLVNTGWCGGGHGVGQRIKLVHTRSILDAIYSGELRGAETERDPVFRLDAISACSNVPKKLLIPSATWSDSSAYANAALRLAERFKINFKKYADKVSAEVLNGGPA